MPSSVVEGAARRWAEVERLFDEALALASSERDGFLQRACSDPALRAEVQKLLDAARKSGDFLERRPAPAAEPATLATGEKLGVYRIERLIGRGGMSEVYLARRDDGQYEQQVALKLLTLSLAQKADSFFNERQILAQLQHPLIGRLLDGGLAPDGRPYMVMEYVEGVNLVQHCAQVRAGLDERLRLFRQVCEAVAYAHRNLVVHRDLKPANILVTPEGQVKLLDFGIAKLLDSGLPLADLTRTLHLTPRYAAPEQLQGRPVTTATDVYALGVLLHELLAGEPPFQLGTMPLAVAVQRILNETPPSLSASAAAHAAAAGVISRRSPALAPGAAAGVISRGSPALAPGAAPVAARLLRGDLDAIAAKALRKEPEARYASAAEFLAELERHRRCEPVAARGYALGYVLRRFVRRHRVLVSAVAMVLIALVAALNVSLWFYVDAERARDRAEAEAKRAEQSAATTQAVNDFLNKDLLAGIPKLFGKVPIQDLTIKQLLERAASEVDTRFKDRPEVAAAVHQSIGASYGAISAFPESMRENEKALALYEKLHGRDSPQALEAIHIIAGQNDLLDRHAEAIKLNEEALRGYLKLYGENDARTVELRMGLAFGYFDAGAFQKAVDQLRTLLASADGTSALSEQDRQDIRSRLSYFLTMTADYHEAEQIERSVLAAREQGAKEDSMEIAEACFILGNSLTEEGQYEEADRLLTRAQAAVLHWLGPDDSFTGTVTMLLGRLRLEQGRPAEAETLLRETLRIREKTFGPETSLVSSTRAILADIYEREGRLKEALAILEQALPVSEKMDGPTHPWTVKQRVQLVTILRGMKQRARAWDALRAVTPEAIAALPPRHPFLAALRREEGLLLLEEKKNAEARGKLGEALDIYRFRLGEDHWRTQRARKELDAALPKT